MTKPDISQAAAILGRKGGRARGKTKARPGMSERMKRYWMSPAAARRRKPNQAKSHAQKTKPQD